MKTPMSILPDVSTLASRLAAALDSNGTAQPVTLLERKRPRMMSTFPNEVVNCQWPDGRKRHLFIKYEARHGHNSFGHRGGIGYEAEVYRRLLQALPDFRPRCYGAHTDRKTGETWLVLEYIGRSVRVSDISVNQGTRQPAALIDIASWIGKFHAGHEGHAANDEFSFLHRYDASYYRGWALRTFEFTRPLRGRFRWLVELGKCGDAWFAPLLARRPTVIHGEFYAKTVLLRHKRLFFVDWESAAIAAGEIDLAALTEGTGWPVKVVRQCEREYRQACWPEGAPADFQTVLDAAKIYLHFRWLGERPDWTVREKTLWRYDHLRAAAKRLGLI